MSDSVAAAAQKHESQTLQAYQELARRIVNLELAPGEVVSEKMLAGSLGIGRTPVREALRELSREGMVIILPQRGIIISEIEVSKQLRILELHRVVIGFVVSAATRRATSAQRGEFQRLSSELAAAQQSVDGETFLALDVELDSLLAASARNEFAASALRLTDGLARRFWFAHYRDAENLAEIIGHHADIARAVSASDEEQALRSINMIHDWQEDFTRRVLDLG